MVNCVVLKTAETVAPAGMPVPLTTMPTRMPVVLVTVTVGEPAVVAPPPSATVVPTGWKPVAAL